MISLKIYLNEIFFRSVQASLLFQPFFQLYLYRKEAFRSWLLYEVSLKILPPKNNKFLCSVRWFYGYISCTQSPKLDPWHDMACQVLPGVTLMVPEHHRAQTYPQTLPMRPILLTLHISHFFKLLIWDSHLVVLRTYSGFSFGDNSGGTQGTLLGYRYWVRVAICKINFQSTF